jgi:hypothetical protein
MQLNRHPIHDPAGDSYDWQNASRGQSRLVVDVWHGTGRRFNAFENQYCGTGEGDSHGYGHYVTPSCRAAEKYAHYDAMSNKTKTPVLYHCSLMVEPGRVLSMDSAWDQKALPENSSLRRDLNSSILQRLDSDPSNVVRELNEAYGPHGARDLMHSEWGIQALFAYADSAPTFIVLDASYLSIREVWEWQAHWVDGRNLMSWDQTYGTSNPGIQQQNRAAAGAGNDRFDAGM